MKANGKSSEFMKNIRSIFSFNKEIQTNQLLSHAITVILNVIEMRFIPFILKFVYNIF
jgi:hypothetical protein